MQPIEHEPKHDIIDTSRNCSVEPRKRNLLSAPRQPVISMAEKDRPQPRRDAERENGLSCFVGRLRECAVFDNKCIALGHNAELTHSQGLIG